MKPIERVEQLIDHYNMNISSFEKAVGLSNNSLGAAIRRGSSLKDETLLQILEEFPDVDPAWLLTGEGNMLRKDNKQKAAPDDNQERLELALAKIIIDLSQCKDDIIKEVRKSRHH